jgi:hypothetical protein
LANSFFFFNFFQKNFYFFQIFLLPPEGLQTSPS